MALKIDNNLIAEVGLSTLPDDDKKAMLQQIRDTLEMRVGTRLAGQMSNEQLDEFEQFVQNQDDSGALGWLEGNFPNYKEIVNEEFEKLKLEIKQSASQILQNSTSQDNQPPEA